jgi:hypothetical protein
MWTGSHEIPPHKTDVPQLLACGPAGGGGCGGLVGDGMSEFDAAWNASYKHGYDDAMDAHGGKSRLELQKLLKDKRYEYGRLTEKHKELSREYSRLSSGKLVYDVLIKFSESETTQIEPVTSSRVVHFLDAVEAGVAGATLTKRKGFGPFPPLSLPEHKALFDEAEIFLIEQEYSKFIENKEELMGAEWRLPFERCCFEFRFVFDKAKLHFLCVTEESAGQKQYRFFVEVRAEGQECWAALEKGEHGEFNDLAHSSDPVRFAAFIENEIRAICVLIDAEVLERQQERVPHLLNEARERRGKLPFYSFHTLRLRRAVRYVGAEFAGERAKNSPRLHLRRGHWRHFPTFKTWVRWTVVGDPSRGFVDKAYRP